MLTYELKKKPGLPLYESLYRCIREDILSGRLVPGEKLPSKRSLSQHLEVSKITVETAYEQLLSEGFIRSVEKVGYFVEEIPQRLPAVSGESRVESLPKHPHTAIEGFPFSVWSKLQREVVLDYGQQLLLPLPNKGIAQLRRAIASYLSDFRGMHVDPENILIGAGTDFLYNLLIQLLGRDLGYAVEDPGYGKIRQIYRAGGVECTYVKMDTKGVMPEELKTARVLHISPNHHFPTGLVTPLSRRKELLRWARDCGGWIIEDDYDSEFRFDAHPLPAMQTLDGERVIYMNSFSKSLAPSIRISYMVLPRQLMEKFQNTLGFYSCTVPSFEQYTLARFLERGYFEKHINRMRKFYRSRRNKMVALVKASSIADKITILEQDAGLHFLLKLETELPDRDINAALEAVHIHFPPLGNYYHEKRENLHCLVVNYSAINENTLETALQVLSDQLTGNMV